jgi:hypothetical protein
VLRTIAAASTNSILIDILLPRRRATISNDNAVSSQQIIGQVERNNPSAAYCTRCSSRPTRSNL